LTEFLAHPTISENTMHNLADNKIFANCSTVPIIVCAKAQTMMGTFACGTLSRSQLALHSSHHQTEYGFGGGLLED